MYALICLLVRAFIPHRESRKTRHQTLAHTSSNINRFSKIFADRLSDKFATKSCLNIPPHLKCRYTTLLNMNVTKLAPI